MNNNTLSIVKHDFSASIVVFLVALPLSMGIAIASGVPVALGLITAVVGGIVTGLITGSPKQVSGPAAGLTVLVFTIVTNYGLPGLAVAVLGAGILQVVAGSLRTGRWFKAINPAVIYGMLAGIGIIILVSQFHVMVDDVPKSSTVQNIITIPTAIYHIFTSSVPYIGLSHRDAGLIGLMTIAIIILWDLFKPKLLKSIPAALLAIVAATAVTYIFKLPLQKVQLPHNILNSIGFIDWHQWTLIKNLSFVHEMFGLAIIASAETLLCATAVDKMHTDPPTKYNHELVAQGLGNMLCGFLGALPMTGVIVRSSANVEAGGRTRLSPILHGVWIALLVISFPTILQQIPLAALAAILVYTGFKLINIKAIKKFIAYGHSELFIYSVTVIGIVTVDLLVGVLAGLIVSLIKLIITISNVTCTSQVSNDDTILDVYLTGAATVLTLPQLDTYFATLRPEGKNVVIHVDDLVYIDHACQDFIDSYIQRSKALGVEVTIDSAKVSDRMHKVLVMKGLHQ